MSGILEFILHAFERKVADLYDTMFEGRGIRLGRVVDSVIPHVGPCRMTSVSQFCSHVQRL